MFSLRSTVIASVILAAIPHAASCSWSTNGHTWELSAYPIQDCQGGSDYAWGTLGQGCHCGEFGSKTSDNVKSFVFTTITPGASIVFYSGTGCTGTVRGSSTTRWMDTSVGVADWAMQSFQVCPY
ncbi:hypothetical protein BV22DRAFT_1039461 [Leucogyrophana mollusca]|uniref:Uncharacterized protein n=1 Tax=Leucogyrophana mollusca TaxID=85980 RepID=A0ACB8B7C0_9AGAM|nr:hypothetical protein BV22DRAFT_1039461 [Leucogyrophana mollusca]